MNKRLLFTKIPENWEEYLPLGNGRLGCMVKTHPCSEVLQLNEEGIWSGGPQNRLNPDTKRYLPQIRQLVRDGNVLDAQALSFAAMSGMGFNDRVYQTAGEFKIDFFSAENSGLECGWPLQHKVDQSCVDSYKACLDLDTACTEVSYKDLHGTTFTRRTWISAVDDVLFMFITADKKGSVNFTGYLDRGIWSDSIYTEDGCIFLEDAHGIPFCAGAGAVATGGTCETTGFCLAGSGCDEVLFFIDIRPWKWDGKPISKNEYDQSIRRKVWVDECKTKLASIRKTVCSCGVGTAAASYFSRHVDEYHSYWNRMSVFIGDSRPNSGQQEKTVAELISDCSRENVQLVNLYAAFSRYLLIAGSRNPGRLPLTLQGLWNCYMDPPWGSKYTININTEMNYWPVHLTSLSECELPLFGLLERAYENGCKAAKLMYGCSGYVLHHNTDYWGDAAPQDTWIPGTYWVLGAAWLATHIWEHYEYTQNKIILKRYYYLIHEACRFFVDYLQPSDILASDGKPYLVINPSLSPENSYVTKTGQVGAFSEGCQMDCMILEHLFSSCLKAYRALNGSACDKNDVPYDESELEDFEYVLLHIQKPSLNADGSLREWNREVEEVEPGHRHISHLYGLFPGHTVSIGKTPELADACKKTLEKRLSHGGGHTGWSQAWILNFRAQLAQGNEALDSLVTLFAKSTLPNLLDNHPPFQIDGNFGALAGIIRMLIQSEAESDGTITVRFLPALPSEKAWQNGSIRGVGIKGGYTVDFDWKDGKVCNIKLHPGKYAVDESVIRYVIAL